VAKGTTAYAAILAELEKKYGKFPANATGYRDAVGNGNYVYRQYSDGRIFIQKSGQGSAPVAPKVVDAKSVPTTGGGLPPWVLPVSVVGGAALIGVGVFIFVKRKGKR
jgi:carbon monoxide dehydrogenase subunit G